MQIISWREKRGKLEGGQKGYITLWLICQVTGPGLLQDLLTVKEIGAGDDLNSFYSILTENVY